MMVLVVLLKRPGLLAITLTEIVQVVVAAGSRVVGQKHLHSARLYLRGGGYI